MRTPLAILTLLYLSVARYAQEASATVLNLGSSNYKPTIKLSYGTFQGNTTGNVDEFLGMPFAAPPIGKLRFAYPQPPLAFDGVRMATSFGAACPQPPSKPAPGFPSIVIPIKNSAEECLFINVYRPANTTASEKLPVVFYIYGGGFAAGDTSQYPGNALIGRSITLQKPVIYVSANYRLSAFGFLGGKEVNDAGVGNAGFQDQRFALQWVQTHIFAFGGDPNKVTIWGESVGAASVALHMMIDDGNTHGLFHRAYMQSGSPINLPSVLDQQQSFDQIVNNTNCTAANDKLTCLRDAPFDVLMNAANQSPIFTNSSLKVSWKPMVDGKLILRNPWVSLQTGKYAKVPFVTGDVEDEGSIFAFAAKDVMTNADFLEFMKSNNFPNINDTDLNAIGQAYPEDIPQGLSSNGGSAAALSPQFRRLTVAQGDAGFQAPRRYFLQLASVTQPTYAFRYARGINTPIFGAFHGSDLAEFFPKNGTLGYIGIDSVVYFTNTGNPNASKGSISSLSNVTWEKWSSSIENPPLLTFIDPAPGVNITSDTFRAEAINLMIRLTLDKIGMAK